MTHRFHSAAMLSLVIPSLAAGQAGASDWGPESPHYRYPAGLSLSLRQELTIPPESATARLQYGRVVARNAVQEHDPHCIFELDTVSDAPQTVRPQTLRVSRVTRSVATVAGMPAWPAPWGDPGPRFSRVAFIDEGGPSHLYFKTEFRLDAPEQPGIRALTCQSNQMAPGIQIMRHLTLDDIRQALGAYFTVNLP